MTPAATDEQVREPAATPNGLPLPWSGDDRLHDGADAIGCPAGTTRYGTRPRHGFAGETLPEPGTP